MTIAPSFTAPRFYVYLEMSNYAVHWAGRAMFSDKNDINTLLYSLSVHDFDPLPKGSRYDHLFDMIDSRYLDQHDIQYMIQKNDLSCDLLYDVILGFETEEDRNAYFRHMYGREIAFHSLVQYMSL